MSRWTIVVLLSLLASLVECEDACESASLVSYRILLKTFWTEDLFPKNYPTFRPPAQWGSGFAQVHNGKYKMFREDLPPGEDFIDFMEFDNVGGLSSLKKKDVYDQFTLPKIGQGAGETSQDFFVESNNSMISLAMKLIPSPDWFIGVDSFDLCQNGSWVDSANITLGPMDAGIFSGLTFTSPKLRLRPPEAVTRITSKSQDHNAGSFYYPHLDKLPDLATVYFTKIEEYIFVVETTTPLDDRELTDDELSSSETTTHFGIGSTATDNETSGDLEIESVSIGFSHGVYIFPQKNKLSDEAQHILDNITLRIQEPELEVKNPKNYRPIIKSRVLDSDYKERRSGNIYKSLLTPGVTRSPVSLSSFFKW